MSFRVRAFSNDEASERGREASGEAVDMHCRRAPLRLRAQHPLKARPLVIPPLPHGPSEESPIAAIVWV
ncbi:hypothetical protein RchiOBHm_Chr2g0147091 [Rosa chinensis]|uniref:Uncharacterized protein n=1 Tax=Rosa chinensis TaxID=74649 RepID=A0A2P6RZ29_ROSCH|nr:hypothetical protein RchiOBHm_Chr2g0147091 [Rosa chinensis]